MPRCSCKTRYIPAIFAWTLFLVTTGLFFYYPCRYFIRHFPWIPIIEGIIAFFVFANFSLATFMDPGIIPKAPPDEDRGDDFRAPLYKNVDISGITVRMKWCVTCKFYRPPRCSHCSVCNHCIETFDHHCPWMNNCIGRRNYRFFFFFLISLSLHMICVFSACAFFVIKHKQREKDPGILVSLIMMILIAILVIPIFGLTGFHMVLVSRGRTTNEQVTGKFKGGYNPFSRGCYRNCCYIQCGPLYPSIQNAKRFIHKRRESVATVVSDNQVKTYTDTSNNNSIRNIVGSHSYNKLSPKREAAQMVYEIDLEQAISSQSNDCESTPPPSLTVQRQGSKKQNNQNLSTHGHETLKESIEQTFDRLNTVANLRGSPHPKHRNMVTDQKSRSYLSNINETSSRLANNTNELSRAPLTMHQRIKAVGIPTPILMSSSSSVRRSNPGTPTQPKRPDFINVSSTTNKSTIYDFPLKSAAGLSYYNNHQINQQQQQHYQQQLHEQTHTYYPNSSNLHGNNFSIDNSQRQYVSGPEYDIQNTKIKENIRELVGSPQKSIYTWKDNCSTFKVEKYSDYQHLNTGNSPTTVTTANDQTYLSQLGAKKQNHVKLYHPSIHGGVAVYPQSSPQTSRKPVILQSQTLPDNRRRPMSFARALEISDSIEMAPTLGNARSNDTPIPTSLNHNNQNENSLLTSDRASVYDTNYEISV